MQCPSFSAHVSHAIALLVKARVVATQNFFEDAGGFPIRVRLQDGHPKTEIIVGLEEHAADLVKVGGASRNVIRWVVWIDDGQAIHVLIGEFLDLVLFRVAESARGLRCEREHVLGLTFSMYFGGLKDMARFL